MPSFHGSTYPRFSLALASQSPRRRMMMQWLGIPVTITHAEIDETPLPGEAPMDLATRLARRKAEAAVANLNSNWVLTADTVVDLDGVSLGKPRDAAEAREMLRQLRNRKHQVHTGITLARAGDLDMVHVRRVTTDVTMRPYTDAEITTYIATDDPMDKAGGYAIQHNGFNPVAGVEVCYANVVGLPLCAVVALLREAGWELDIDVPTLCARHFGYNCPGPDMGTQV